MSDHKPASLPGTTPTKSQVRFNAERDPEYRPYCLRCPGLIRMVKVDSFYWRCAICGAEHDERESGGTTTTTGEARFRSASCNGERCTLCGKSADAKVEEAIAFDDPFPNRHPFTAYVCAAHFDAIMHRGVSGGAGAPTDDTLQQLVEWVESAAWEAENTAEGNRARMRIGGEETQRTYQLRATESDREAAGLRSLAKQLPELFALRSRLESAEAKLVLLLGVLVEAEGGSPAPLD